MENLENSMNELNCFDLKVNYDSVILARRIIKKIYENEEHHLLLYHLNIIPPEWSKFIRKLIKDKAIKIADEQNIHDRDYWIEKFVKIETEILLMTILSEVKIEKILFKNKINTLLENFTFADVSEMIEKHNLNSTESNLLHDFVKTHILV